MTDFFGNDRFQSNFTLINFSADLLGSYYNARTLTRGVSVIQNTARPIERGPAVVTPWALDGAGSQRSLVGQYNALRNKSNFIDLQSKSVKQTDNKDEKALFVLYRALNDLKVLADYGAEKNTTTSRLAKLNTQFGGGLSQVQDYIRAAELDKLTLMFGKKKSSINTDISLGKNNYDVTGSVLSVASKTAAIPGLAGNEVFTVKLDTGSVTDNITVDLSQITGTLNLTNLVSFINQQISALTVTDVNGNIVSKYKTRFLAEEVSTGDFALKVDVFASEAITLTAQTADPSLYVTGSQQAVGTGAIETATLSKINDLNTTGPTTEFTRTIAGSELNNFLPPLLDENGQTIETPPAQLETKANATAVDSQGNVYVVGTSQGDIGNQINAASGQDVFLSKYDASGNVLWSRLLGATDQSDVFDLVIDGSDNIIIAGQVNDELVTTDVFTGYDSFVTKFDSRGEELWTYQQDTAATDQANSLAIDANGDVIVTGSISGQLNSGTSYGGASDIFVTRLAGLDGTLSASAQIGGAGSETGEAVAIAGDGNILVASRESGRVIIRKLDATNLSNQLASYDLGDLSNGKISDIVVDASGAIFVAGTTNNGTLSGGTVTNGYSGGRDGFVTRLTDSGGTLAADWTYFLGSSGAEDIEGLTVQNGAVFIAGKTDGTLPGATKTGSTDGFAAKIDAGTGAANWVRQFGGATGFNGSTGLAFSATGSSVLTKLGLPTGLYDGRETRNIETQTSAREGDYFYISVDGKRAQKIAINADDTFSTLATRIQRLSYRFIKATQTLGTNGPELKIESLNGSTLDIVAGDGARDALVKLGIQPGKVMPANKVFAVGEEALGTDPNNLGGIFGLELLSGLSLRSKQEAEFVSSELGKAIETVKRAFRSLTYDPVKADILKQSKIQGQASPYQLSRLSNYQEGLRRLSFLGGGGLNIFS